MGPVYLSIIGMSPLWYRKPDYNQQGLSRENRGCCERNFHSDTFFYFFSLFGKKVNYLLSSHKHLFLIVYLIF